MEMMEGDHTNPNATKKRRGEEVEVEPVVSEGVAVGDCTNVAVGLVVLKFIVGVAIVYWCHSTLSCSV
jgi:hypothetical protein